MSSDSRGTQDLGLQGGPSILSAHDQRKGYDVFQHIFMPSLKLYCLSLLSHLLNMIITAVIREKAAIAYRAVVMPLAD